jgi:hypothetical protein
MPEVKSMKHWVGHEFDSSSGLTEDWAKFARDMKLYLYGIFKSEYKLVSFSRGHFYFSSFFKNIKTDKLVYISCSDVRYFPGQWHNDLLIRTAKHEKDYTGGSNNTCSLNELRKMADKLTKETCDHSDAKHVLAYMCGKCGFSTEQRMEDVK